MSKPRYDWWGHARNIAAGWKDLKKEYDDLHEANITAQLSGMPPGGNVSRGTEEIALRTLKEYQQQRYDAGVFAMSEIKKIWGRDGEKVIRLIFWNKRQKLNIAGAGEKVGFSERTDRRIHWRFILAIGRGMNWITQEEYNQAIKKDNN